MPSEMRKQSACGAADGLSPGLLREKFVGCGRAGPGQLKVRKNHLSPGPACRRERAAVHTYGTE